MIIKKFMKGEMRRCNMREGACNEFDEEGNFEYELIPKKRKLNGYNSNSTGAYSELDDFRRGSYTYRSKESYWANEVQSNSKKRLKNQSSVSSRKSISRSSRGRVQMLPSRFNDSVVDIWKSEECGIDDTDMGIEDDEFEDRKDFYSDKYRYTSKFGSVSSTSLPFYAVEGNREAGQLGCNGFQYRNCNTAEFLSSGNLLIEDEELVPRYRYTGLDKLRRERAHKKITSHTRMATTATLFLSRLSFFRFTTNKSSSIKTNPFFLYSKTTKSPNRSRLISMASEAKESASNNPGLHTTPDEATKGYIMQQTMFRIKDPKVSLDFYSRILGMSLLKRLDFPEMKFSLYFLGYEDHASAPGNSVERTVWTFGRKATIELTHNWGTENDPEFKYHNGNSEPRGFGHIGVTVDDTYKACERFERLGVEFVKKPEDGKMKGIAFIKDPDGYWIEIFDLKTIGKITESAA